MLALRPDSAAVHNSLGNALKDQGKFDEAAAEFERAVTLGPDLAEGHNNLACILCGSRVSSTRPWRIIGARSLCGPTWPKYTTTWATR